MDDPAINYCVLCVGYSIGAIAYMMMAARYHADAKLKSSLHYRNLAVACALMALSSSQSAVGCAMVARYYFLHPRHEQPAAEMHAGDAPRSESRPPAERGGLVPVISPSTLPLVPLSY